MTRELRTIKLTILEVNVAVVGKYEPVGLHIVDDAVPALKLEVESFLGVVRCLYANVWTMGKDDVKLAKTIDNLGG